MGVKSGGSAQYAMRHTDWVTRNNKPLAMAKNITKTVEVAKHASFFKFGNRVDDNVLHYLIEVSLYHKIIVPGSQNA
jgi:hypothetical protein